MSLKQTTIFTAAIVISIAVHAGLLFIHGSEQRIGDSGQSLKLAIAPAVTPVATQAEKPSPVVSKQVKPAQPITKRAPASTSTRPQPVLESASLTKQTVAKPLPEKQAVPTVTKVNKQADAHTETDVAATTQQEITTTSLQSTPTVASHTVKASTSQPRSLLKQKRQLQNVIRAAFQPHFYYPRMAVRRGWQGDVMLGLHIKANGKLQTITVVSSSGYSILDNAALNSMQKVESLPEASRLLNGATMDLLLPVTFTLL